MTIERAMKITAMWAVIQLSDPQLTAFQMLEEVCKSAKCSRLDVIDALLMVKNTLA